MGERISESMCSKHNNLNSIQLAITISICKHTGRHTGYARSTEGKRDKTETVLFHFVTHKAHSTYLREIMMSFASNTLTFTITIPAEKVAKISAKRTKRQATNHD